MLTGLVKRLGKQNGLEETVEIIVAIRAGFCSGLSLVYPATAPATGSGAPTVPRHKSIVQPCRNFTTITISYQPVLV